MNLLKNFTLNSFILFCFCTTNAQSNVRSLSLMATLPEYKIVNTVINDLMDSLSVNSENCIFCLLNKPYYFLIDFRKIDDTITVITANVEQYHILILENKLRSAKSKGHFYWNNILTIVYSNNDLSSFFIYKNDSLKNLYYQYEPLIIPTYLKSVEHASMQYKYSESKLKKEWERKCNNKAYFFEEIKEGDTWESLLLGCRCSKEILHFLDGKYMEELPKVGEYLIIEYEIDENNTVKMKRISLKTVFSEDKLK